MLQLNSEQEAALRAFVKAWAPVRNYESNPAETVTDALYDAIAPLMKPWRVGERGAHDDGMLLGPNDERWGIWRQSSKLSHGHLDASMAQRICDLLNEHEAR